MSFRRAVGYSVSCGLLAFALAGCVTPCTVLTATKTPPAFGNIKLYGTDNVPFEYEEIGVHSLFYSKVDLDGALNQYAEQVRNLGADAVLGFRVSHVVSHQAILGFSLFWNDTQYELSGVAVKIKRP